MRSSRLIIALASIGVALSCLSGLPGMAAAPDGPVESLGSCTVWMPPETTTIVYKTYGGGLTSKYRLLEEPNGYLGRTQITVPKRNGPLFLILSAYNPTQWELNIEPGAQIAAILVLGYHHQIVSHVPPRTEVGFSIFVGGTGQDCPRGDILTNNDLMVPLRPLLNARFSRKVDEYYVAEWEECAKKGCVGFPKTISGKEPQVSWWDSWFGAKPVAVPEPVGSVRTSAPLFVSE